MGSLVETCVKKVRRKHGLPRRVEHMSKEVLQITLLKKRECNRKAQIIVERLLEETVPEDWFLCSLQYIGESHFQDAVEERALAKLCGYPLCRGQLPPAPSQQFRISTRFNKVYDITDRKNFCGNQCYAAAKFLKQQLLTSPLWLRDKEEVPVFTLLPTAGASEGVGDELDFSVEKMAANQSEHPHESAVTERTDASLPELETHAANAESKNGSGSKLGTRLLVREWASGELESSPQDRGLETGVSGTRNLKKDCNDANSAPQTVGKVEVAASRKHEGEMMNIILDGVSSNCAVTGNGGSFMGSGITGCKQTKLGSPNIECTVELDSLGSTCTMLGNVNGEHTNAACDCPAVGKLKTELEAVGKQCDAEKKGEGDKKCRSKKGGEEESGLQGVVLYVEKCVKEWFTVETLQLLRGKESREPVGDPGVPLVDHHAQFALRRRIVLDRLNRVVPDLMAALGVPSCDVSSDVRELVATFRLSAQNITFHVPEWNLVGLVLISIVSLKNERLRQQLRSKKVKDAQTMILLSFQQDSGYLDRLVCWLTDVDHKTC